MAMPDAARSGLHRQSLPGTSELLYRVDDDARLFHRLPVEAVAVGRIAGYIFPALNSIELYRVAGKPVYLPHLVIGLALTARGNGSELSRHSPERDLPKLEHLWHAGAFSLSS